jgi:hypothetical protein
MHWIQAEQDLGGRGFSGRPYRSRNLGYRLRRAGRVCALVVITSIYYQPGLYRRCSSRWE